MVGEGAVLLCQGRRLLPEGAVILNRVARLLRFIPYQVNTRTICRHHPPSGGVRIGILVQIWVVNSHPAQRGGGVWDVD